MVLQSTYYGHLGVKMLQRSGSVHIIGNLGVENDKSCFFNSFSGSYCSFKSIMIHGRWEKASPELHVAFGIVPKQEVSLCGLLCIINA